MQKLLHLDHALGECGKLALERVRLRDHVVLELYLGVDRLL